MTDNISLDKYGQDGRVVKELDHVSRLPGKHSEITGDVHARFFDTTDVPPQIDNKNMGTLFP